MNRLKEKYLKEVIPALMKNLNIANPLAVPKLLKVVVNAGIGSKVAKNSAFLEQAKKELMMITGQAPISTLAKKAVSGFKVRKGQIVGLKTTLRGERMYDFIDKLISVTLPRVRDFRGLSQKDFDGHGNFTIGIKEHLAFPESSTEDVSGIFSCEITVVTNAGNDKKGYELLKALGFPFREKE